MTWQERFWSNVDKSGECWLWTRSTKGSSGYGRFSYTVDRGVTRSDYAHRIAYELIVGPISEGLHLDHLCRVRACVRPTHLEPVTPAENTLRGQGAAARNARKTHCRRGHAFTEQNTIPYRGGRKCRACEPLHNEITLARYHVQRLVPDAIVRPHPTAMSGLVYVPEDTWRTLIAPALEEFYGPEGMSA